MPFLSLPFPAFDPVALQIGPLAIRWYALAYIAGIFIGWWYVRRLVDAPRLWGAVNRPSLAEVDDFILWAAVGVIFGGRLGYVLFYNPMHYLEHPAEIVMVWNGGMAFHGAFIGSVAAMALFARGRAFSVLSLFDLFAAAVPVGLLFGRLANFINGELWGRPSDVAWAVVFPFAGPEPRHPSQLYEAGLEGIALFVLLRIASHYFLALKRPGTIAGAFALFYGLARFVVEFFRMPDAQVGYLFGFATMGQLLSLPMILAGLALLFWAGRREAGQTRAGL